MPIGRPKRNCRSTRSALGFSDEDRGRVLYQVALWTVASYEPESAQRLNAVPAAAYDERLHEWRVREAMARSDWPAALAAIRKMGDKQRSDSRWQYFEARLAERTGDKAAAQRLYREAANKPEFHGFLAADKIDAAVRAVPVAARRRRRRPRRRSRAIRRSCARWGCTASSAAAGPRANGTTR